MAVPAPNTINITLQTGVFSRQGFNTTLVLAPHKLTNDRVFAIESADDLVNTYGLETTDPLYKWASAFFSASPSPAKMKVGRIQVDSVEITPTAEDSTNYDVVINGVTYRYTSDGSALVAEITAGLTAIVNDGYAIAAVSQLNKTFSIAGNYASLFTEGVVIPIDGSTGNDGNYTVVSAVYSAPNTVITVSEDIPSAVADGNIKDDSVAATDGTTKVTIASAVAGTAWTFSVGDSDLLAVTAWNSTEISETIADAFAAIILEDDDFYGVATTLRDAASQASVAAWTLSNERLCLLASDDTNLPNQTAAVDTTSIGYTLVNTSNTRAHVIYHPDAEDANNLCDECPEATLFGEYFGTEPGVAQVEYMNLPGISGYTLTATQRNNLNDKKVGFLQYIADTWVIRRGVTGGGEWIDVIRDVDTLRQELKEDLDYFMITSRKKKKISYTKSGVTALEGVVRKRLALRTVNSQGVGILAEYDEEQGDYFTVTDVANIAAADRAARKYAGIKFGRRVAGAINELVVTGYIGV